MSAQKKRYHKSCDALQNKDAVFRQPVLQAMAHRYSYLHGALYHDHIGQRQRKNCGHDRSTGGQPIGKHGPHGLPPYCDNSVITKGGVRATVAPQ